MAVSIALVLLLGLTADHIFTKLRLPGLVGMLLVGVVCGPHVLDVIRPELLRVSADFRMAALIVILLRAGLKIRKDALNKVGRTAAFMSFVPSTLEGLAVMALAPLLLGMGVAESALLGFIVAAVSPAVVVPSMIGFMDKGLGAKKGIPTMVLAASSLDNAYVIVVFTALLGISTGQGGDIFLKLAGVPVSIALGIGMGTAVGFALCRLFRRSRPRHTKKALIVVGVAVLLVWAEGALRPYVPVSALLGVMAIGFVLLEKAEADAHAIAAKLGKVWVGAEILLFALVGAQVDIHVAWDAGLAGAALVTAGLVARAAGTYLSVMGAGLSMKERLFCVVSYVPKATVQAAMGAVPMAAGVKGGEVMLAVAVLAILTTAPLGSIGISYTGRRWLRQGE
jgi:NhaP-type Na+/H+ or K+/H+ antiporter